VTIGSRGKSVASYAFAQIEQASTTSRNQSFKHNVLVAQEKLYKAQQLAAPKRTPVD